VSIVPPPPEEPELGDKPAQLRRLADVTKALLHCMQEEKEQALVQTKFEEKKAQIQQEKE
jgi:hypothetical protein